MDLIADFRETEQMIKDDINLQRAVVLSENRQMFYPHSLKVPLPDEYWKKPKSSVCHEEKAPVRILNLKALDIAGRYKEETKPPKFEKVIIDDKACGHCRKIWAEPDEETVRAIETKVPYGGIPLKFAGRIGVLNFANPVKPGGGVESGATAQEEYLCRNTTLFDSLDTPMAKEKYYQPHKNWGRKDIELGNDDILFNRRIVVIKNEGEVFPEDERYNICVITCAAPHTFSDKGFRKLKKTLNKRIDKIFRVAIDNGIDYLILGAFGCGSFGNPPELVAEIMKEKCDKYGNYFRNIDFAIYCTDEEQRNYNIFKSVFGL